MLLYNTAKRAKEEFVPITPGQVKMYVCGPTVYNYFHIGNARAFLTFDVLRRYFEFRGYKVDYVQNITDIEDKIIAQSLEEGVSYKEVADKYATAFLDDSAALGIRRPTHQPRATEVLPEIIAAIAALEKSGHAYEVNGDVYFNTASLPEYGQLSGKKTEEQLPGARVLENLHALESRKTRRARLEQPLGRRTARLAHRMRGDGPEVSGRNLRHPRRRRRPHFPPSRE